jgi:hypothetical protein
MPSGAAAIRPIRTVRSSPGNESRGTQARGQVSRLVVGAGLPGDCLAASGEVVPLPGDQPVEIGSCHPNVTRAGDVAAAHADGSQKRAVPLIPDPSGRLGLQSPHLLVIDREQGIDGCHRVTLRATELIFSAGLAVAISAIAQPALYGQGRRTRPCPGRCPRRPDRAASTGRNQTGLDRSCDGAVRAMRALAWFLLHVSCQQAPAATDTFPRSAASTFIRPECCIVQLTAGLVNGRRPGGTSQKTGLRTRRHHQHHDPGVPDQPERHETPDPPRSNAVNPRIQHARQASGCPEGVRLAGWPPASGIRHPAGGWRLAAGR